MKPKSKFTPKTGWVYVVTNDCLKPVVVTAGPHQGEEVPAVKIGNAKEFTNRLGSLNTAVYENFNFHMGIKTDNVVGLEKIIHTALLDYQIKTRDGDLTEFFACPLKEVVSRIKKLVVGGHMIDYEEYNGGRVIGRSGSKIRSNIKKQAVAKNTVQCDLPFAKKGKAMPTTIAVTFPDCEVIALPKAKDVFVKAIEKLGVEKVSALGFKTIISKNPKDFGKYVNAKAEVDGWYICTHSSTSDKIKHLKTFAKALGVDLSIKTLSKQ